MFLPQLDLTSALRPALLPDEILLFVQDAIGLYEGKFKIAEYQNGAAYLTSHRACYVDNEDPRNKAVAINLRDVDRCELYAGFLKSSPKITLYPKAAKHLSAGAKPGLALHGISHQPANSGQSSNDTSYRPSPIVPLNATWICSICSFSNPIPSNFEPALANENTPVPPCLACGIKPPFIHVVKAAIASITNRSSNDYSQTLSATGKSIPQLDFPPQLPGNQPLAFQCPRCTFQNHPSLLSCEICGAPLLSNPAQITLSKPDRAARSESPGPSGPSLTAPAHISDPTESVKFSFRGGGEKIFHERLKGALTQRKWLLKSAPSAPRASNIANENATGIPSPQPVKHIGIAGLERRGQELRKNNELVIGNAFEDLSALMGSAKEIIALAEQFASQTKGSASESPTNLSSTDTAALLSQLNLTTTRDMLGRNSANVNNLYLTELSRQIAEFLIDDTKGVLKSEGGIISLVDLWAVFNRARGGVELVSPTDFGDAAQLFDKLKLPIRLRRFKSGLLVVQGSDRTDEKTIKALLAWLRQLREIPPERDVPWDWYKWGQGVTALEVAERFRWSVGVATEELEMAEESGALCREVCVEGIRFWENFMMVEG